MNDILGDCRTAGNLNGHNMCMYGVFVNNLGTFREGNIDMSMEGNHG